MNTQMNQAFADLLKQHRHAAGLTQEALAERAGLGVRSIQALERGESRPLRDTLGRLAAALDLPEGERARFLAAGPPAPRRATSVGAIAAVPPPPPVLPYNLPLELTSFVGRTQAIAEVTDLLASTRLLTLTGTGGVGKTRLALRVAAQCVDRFADGVRLVELAPLADPTLVPGAALAAVAVREQPGRSPLDTLRDHLRDRHALILLDNCEHLLDAGARLAEALLHGCPRITILVTSREPLGLAGETRWRVPSLSLPTADQDASPEAIARCEAVQLFLDRAHSVQPHFALTPANAATVAAICARLDGIPLALELAAAQGRAIGLADLAARLDQRFRVLTGGSRTALPRQQTLRAAVNWSYDLLTEPERTLFARLAVFAGGFTLSAAEAVCAGGELGDGAVLGLLVRLVDTSLVLADEAEGAVTRYRLLETLRQYGAERLAAREDAEAIHWRHAAHYLALAEQAESHLASPEQEGWRGRLPVELDNLRAAYRWFLVRGAADEGLRLAVALNALWVGREPYAETWTYLEQALALPGAALSSARTWATVRAGWSSLMLGNLAAGRRRLEEGMLLARERGERPTMARALLGLGMMAIYQADYSRARTALEESLTLYRPLDDLWGLGVALCHLARVVNLQGEHAVAHTLLDEALARARGAGEHHLAAMALEVRGEVAFAVGDNAQAGRLWAESLDHFGRLGIILGLATVEIFLGLLALRLGDLQAARVHYQASLEHQRGWVHWITRALAGLAAVAAAGGQAEHALRLAGASLALGDGDGFALPAPERAVLARAIETARAALSEPAATAAWAAGQAMTLEEAVAYALAHKTGN